MVADRDWESQIGLGTCECNYKSLVLHPPGSPSSVSVPLERDGVRHARVAGET